MSSWVLILLLVGLVVLSIVLSAVRLGLLSMSHYQLKLRAQRGEKHAKLIYPIHFQRHHIALVLSLLLYAIGASVILVLQKEMGTFFAICVGALLLLFMTEVLPHSLPRRYTTKLVVWCAPLLRKISGAIMPLTRHLNKVFERLDVRLEPRVYAREQLEQIFKLLHEQPDSDITKEELHLLEGALSFSRKKIRDAMTPRRMVTLVVKTDEVGPLLMDELHRSGHSRFPVAESNDKQVTFVGTLYLRDLVGQKSLRKVEELMSQDVKYIHEEETLDAALRAFLKTHHHLFVVVNNFEEFVGVLSIEDVIEEVIGTEIVDEFDAYDDLRAVAARMAQADKSDREKVSNKKK
jgi:CBS domain containing-hemolysin-like protein